MTRHREPTDLAISLAVERRGKNGKSRYFELFRRLSATGAS